MTAILRISTDWVLSDILSLAEQDIARAYTIGNQLVMPDVTQAAADAALNSYDHISSQIAMEWQRVRDERSQKLAATDWTQVADSPLSDDLKTLFAIYRQQLRDITQQQMPVTWPVEPSLEASELAENVE